MIQKSSLNANYIEVLYKQSRPNYNKSLTKAGSLRGGTLPYNVRIKNKCLR